MRKDILEIRYSLTDIAEKEATYLYRLAWRMTAHGCKPENIAEVREEANTLHMMSYPERLLDPFKRWEYAFRV